MDASKLNCQKIFMHATFEWKIFKYLISGNIGNELNLAFGSRGLKCQIKFWEYLTPGDLLQVRLGR